MKTKFFIKTHLEAFEDAENNIEVEEIYEKYYKNEGWTLDVCQEEIFMILDKEINLNEGDRVNFYGIRIIKWKCINLIEDIIEYELQPE